MNFLRKKTDKLGIYEKNLNKNKLETSNNQHEINWKCSCLQVSNLPRNKNRARGMENSFTSSNRYRQRLIIEHIGSEQPKILRIFQSSQMGILRIIYDQKIDDEEIQGRQIILQSYPTSIKNESFSRRKMQR